MRWPGEYVHRRAGLHHVSADLVPEREHLGVTDVETSIVLRIDKHGTGVVNKR
jgi:hypothetical protein